MMILCENIVWDTDGEDVSLPATVRVTAETEDDAADALSDTYGWCVVSFCIRPVRPTAENAKYHSDISENIDHVSGQQQVI